VILRQPVDHPRRAVAERNESGRCEDAGLAHSAAEQLSGSPGALDERPIPDND